MTDSTPHPHADPHPDPHPRSHSDSDAQPDRQAEPAAGSGAAEQGRLDASGEARLRADRQAKLNRLRDEFGVDPYGGRVDGVMSMHAARERYDQEADAEHKAGGGGGGSGGSEGGVDRRPRVLVAGRVMQHRVMGNLIFMSLRDASGDLQVAVSKKAVGLEVFKVAKLADYGDLVAASGPLAKTKTGEVTVWAAGPEGKDAGGVGDETGGGGLAEGYRLLTKSLALPPGKHHGLTDAETRYRQRYVDLYANPGVMRTMQLRSRIIQVMREFLLGRGFVEVETPMLQTLHGGAAAKPFKTHHNALDMPLTLRIAPELYLKRLLVGGMPKVFEINRNFRNEGISPRHNPEFTMLEAYEAYGSWETMAELVENMVCMAAEKVCGGLVLNRGAGEDAEPGSLEEAKGGKTIDLSRPWRRVSMVDLVEERTGWRFEKQAATQAQMDALRSANPDKDLKFAGSPAEQLVEVYEKVIEHTLMDPCFVTRVPSVVIPLAKKCEDDPYFADVYELAINGQEISPGYSELNDPAVQEANFRDQVGDKEEQQQIDEDFLEALRVGMPPAGGMGLGVDRLVMLLTGAVSIRDVILFPLMRPESGG